MNNVTIKDRSGKVLFEGGSESLKELLVKAVRERAYLRGAYLRGADLRGADLQGAYLRGAYLRGAYLQEADLQGAYLRGAYLRGAYLQGADLRGAYLRGAYLRGAYLQGADLRGADLRGAYLRGAYLRGAKISWDSHALVSEILYQSAGQDIEKRKIAGLIAISTDWCWAEFVLMTSDSLFEWAMSELAQWVTEGDNAPASLRVLNKKAAEGETS